MLAWQYNATQSLEHVLAFGADPNQGRGGLIGAKRMAEAEGNTAIAGARDINAPTLAPLSDLSLSLCCPSTSSPYPRSHLAFTPRADMLENATIMSTDAMTAAMKDRQAKQQEKATAHKEKTKLGAPTPSQVVPSRPDVPTCPDPCRPVPSTAVGNRPRSAEISQMKKAGLNQPKKGSSKKLDTSKAAGKGGGGKSSARGKSPRSSKRAASPRGSRNYSSRK